MNWRFNLRMSNTEPIIRLNVESKGDVLLDGRKDQRTFRCYQSLNNLCPSAVSNTESISHSHTSGNLYFVSLWITIFTWMTFYYQLR